MESKSNLNLFTVSPMAKNLNLDPGETYEDTIIVTNPAASEQTFSYSVEAVAYTVDEADSASFTTETDRTLIKDWIEIENPTGTLEPNESKHIHFKITVPESAPGGGQYAALMVSSTEKQVSKDDVSVGNIYEIASIIYAKVKGEVTRGGEILENQVPGFATALPVKLKARISNQGNIHEIAKVRVEVREHFSGDVVYPPTANEGVIEEMIMPSSEHEAARDIDGLSQLGVYDVIQTVEYLGKTSENTQTLVVCPIWFIVLVVVAVIAVVGSIIGIVRHHRKRRAV